VPFGRVMPLDRNGPHPATPERPLAP